MRLAHDKASVDALRAPSPQAPWRVLVSACLVGEPCGVDGTDYGLGSTIGALLACKAVVAVPFCPERFALGVPRTMPDLQGGDGFAFLDGRARVLDEHGTDLSAEMLRGAEAMLALAREQRVDFAVLTDMSAACGSQVISDGCRLVGERRYQLGVGVAAALLLRNGVPVVSQRDFATLGRLCRRLDPGFPVDEAAKDHHEHPWVLENLPARP